METLNRTGNTPLLLSGIITTCCLLFNMVMIPLRHETFFTSDGVPDPIGWVIIGGFFLVTVFTISSMVWILIRADGMMTFTTREVIGLIWGSFCILFMVGEKVMIDEIAREWRMGMETTGEWVILYGFFAVQLGYNLFMMSRLRRPRQVTGAPAEP